MSKRAEKQKKRREKRAVKKPRYGFNRANFLQPPILFIYLFPHTNRLRVCTYICSNGSEASERTTQ
jgi:hypothetical protein